MAVDHNNPQSRTEEILIATIDGNEYNKLPQSRLEELLLELKEVIEEGGGGEGGLIQKIFLNGVEQEVVNKAVYLTVITNAVNDLVNYYLKTDTYSKLEVNNLIAAISTLHLQKVETLPTEDISQTTIYLVPKTTLLTNNVYDEYINTDGTSEGWELIGDTQIDLSDYVTFTDLEALLDDYVLATDLETALDSKVDKVAGKGLSSNDFTDEYKTAIGANTTAISGIKDGQSIDSFADVESALSDVDDDVSTLKSGFTNLDNEVNGDATTYPYADVITIEDAVPSNLADCSVKIEPVQDLHGYDKPWVGGAGKNLLPMTVDGIKAANTIGTWSGNTYTIYNVTITLLTDDGGNITGIQFGGTSTDSIYFILCDYFDTSLYASAIYLNGCPANGSNETYQLMLYKYNGATNVSDTGTGSLSFIISDSSAIAQIVIRSGVNTNNLVFHPMLRLATETDATFAPYTNICPISGHTEASVQTEGKNLFDKTEIDDNYILDQSTGLLIPLNGYYVTNYIPVIKGVPVYIPSTGSTRRWFYDVLKQPIIGFVADVYTPEDDGFIRVTASKEIVTVDDLQIELGTRATAYTPYVTPHTATISLGDTIYGGTVDFDTGKVVITKGRQNLGELTWTKDASGIFYSQTISDADKGLINMVCDSYPYDKTINFEIPSYATYNDHQLYRNVNSYFIYVKDTTYETATALKTALNGVYVVYDLATPTTIQLTPQQIQLLKGQNTLTASTGDISVTVNGVSGSIGAVQEQVNATDEALAELAEKLPTAPTTDGAYVLTVTVADGTPTYSWESAT